MGDTPGRRLVQHQHGGLGHQRAADRDLLALAAGELARRPVPVLPDGREELEDPFHGFPDALAPEERAHLQVFAHRQGCEHIVGLRHESHAAPDPVLGARGR